MKRIKRRKEKRANIDKNSHTQLVFITWLKILWKSHPGVGSENEWELLHMIKRYISYLENRYVVREDIPHSFRLGKGIKITRLIFSEGEAQLGRNIRPDRK